MESVIIDATPKGSAILAYGRAPESRFRFAFIALAVIGGFALIAAAALALTLRTIPLPPHRLITISATPAALSERLGADVVSDLPPSWRTVIRSGKKTPAIFGVALDETGAPYPFAFAFGSVAGTNASRVTHEPFRTLLVDRATVPAERVSTLSLLGIMNELRRTDASFLIGANELRAFVGQSSSTDGAVRGRWVNGRGELDLSVSGEADAAIESTPFVVVLGGDKNGSAIMKSAFITQGIDIRSIPAPLQRATFSSSPWTAGATFAGPLAGEDALAASAAFGEYGIRDLNFNDATKSEELTVPTSTLFGDRQTFFSAENPPTSTAIAAPTCPGNLIFKLDGDILFNTLKEIGIPSSISKPIRSAVITEERGKSYVCIE